MKSISLKAGRRLQILQILEGIKSEISKNRITLAAISAGICYFASILGREPIMYAAAFSTLAIISPLIEKGGEK